MYRTQSQRIRGLLTPKPPPRPPPRPPPQPPHMPSTPFRPLRLARKIYVSRIGGRNPGKKNIMHTGHLQWTYSNDRNKWAFIKNELKRKR